MNKETNKKTEEILNSLNGVRKASVPDFFYTRLKARMLARLEGGEKELGGQNKRWIIRPAFAFAALALVLLLNTFVVFQKNETGNELPGDNTDIAQSFATDYSLNDNNIYDLNQDDK